MYHFCHPWIGITVVHTYLAFLWWLHETGHGQRSCLNKKLETKLTVPSVLIDILRVSALIFKATWWGSIFNWYFYLYFKNKHKLTLVKHGLNCMDPPICRFLSIVNTTVLPNLRLDAKGPQIQRANYKLYTDFQLWGGSVPLILTLGSTVLRFRK